MKICKTFTFEAAHQLPQEECYGKCSNLHGHSYRLEVIIEGSIDQRGWVMNFGDLKKIVNNLVIDRYDHSFLNEHFIISTAENICLKIINDLIGAFRDTSISGVGVRLWETQSCYVEEFIKL